ncbi:MAG: MoaD/ThiS family protein [Halobacteriales archaeon]
MAVLCAPEVIVEGAPTDGVELAGDTVGEVLDSHAERYGPQLREAVTDGRGLASHVDVYVDGEGVRRERGLATPVDPGSEVRIVPRLYQG